MTIWTYNQGSQMLANDHDEQFHNCYSGFAPHMNVPADESLVGMGPLPRGAYNCGNPEDHPGLGPNTIPLTPRKYTDTHGRSGFFIHGDSATHPGQASHGCIVAPPNVRSLFCAGDVLIVWA